MTHAQLTALRNEIAATLEAIGATPTEVTAFLAGATLIGHLTPGGSAPYIAARIYQLQHLSPIDNPLSHYGSATQPTTPPTPPTNQTPWPTSPKN
jgi:hypothetical protein